SIISQPAFVNTNNDSSLRDNTSLQYYISTYDGFGETVPVALNNLPGDPNATQKQVEFSFEMNEAANGYFIYREENNNTIYKMGPFPLPDGNIVNFTDKGHFGSQVSSLPTQDTTKASAYRPTTTDLPDRVEFTYKFYGKNEEF